jgi:molecular chaperone DnaK
LKAVRQALESGDIARIRSEADALENAMQRIGQEVYSQNGATAGAGSSPNNHASEGEAGTIEGEFREV